MDKFFNETVQLIFLQDQYNMNSFPPMMTPEFISRQTSDLNFSVNSVGASMNKTEDLQSYMPGKAMT